MESTSPLAICPVFGFHYTAHPGMPALEIVEYLETALVQFNGIVERAGG